MAGQLGSCWALLDSLGHGAPACADITLHTLMSRSWNTCNSRAAMSSASAQPAPETATAVATLRQPWIGLSYPSILYSGLNLGLSVVWYIQRGLAGHWKQQCIDLSLGGPLFWWRRRWRLEAIL